MAKRKHWTQTPEGRARMREIALATDNLAKAREARAAKANGKVEKETKVEKRRGVTFSMYDWKIIVSGNEIRIVRK